MSDLEEEYCRVIGDAEIVREYKDSDDQ